MTANTHSPRAWFVYIVRCADSSLYTGIARDPAVRLAEHNAGRGAKYTRARRPVTLVYTESADDRSSASRREHEIKQLSVVEKRALVASARHLLSEPVSEPATES